MDLWDWVRTPTVHTTCARLYPLHVQEARGYPRYQIPAKFGAGRPLVEQVPIPFVDASYPQPVVQGSSPAPGVVPSLSPLYPAPSRVPHPLLSGCKKPRLLHLCSRHMSARCRTSGSPVHSVEGIDSGPDGHSRKIRPNPEQLVCV